MSWQGPYSTAECGLFRVGQGLEKSSQKIMTGDEANYQPGAQRRGVPLYTLV